MIYLKFIIIDSDIGYSSSVEEMEYLDYHLDYNFTEQYNVNDDIALPLLF